MKKFEETYRNNLQSHNRVASGNLINSIKTTLKISDGSQFEVTLHVADYYWYVDKGRRAGKQPPPDAILKWIETKPILPRPDTRGKLPSNKQLAYLIGRKIGKYGTVGTNDLQQTIDQLNSYYLELIKKTLEDDWYEYSMSILEDIKKIRI